MPLRSRKRGYWGLALTAVIAGVFGVGVGTALRFQVVPTVAENTLDPDQAFPPLADWPPKEPRAQRFNRNSESIPQRRLLPAAEAATSLPESEILDAALDEANLSAPLDTEPAINDVLPSERLGNADEPVAPSPLSPSDLSSERLERRQTPLTDAPNPEIVPSPSRESAPEIAPAPVLSPPNANGIAPTAPALDLPDKVQSMPPAAPAPAATNLGEASTATE